MILIIRFNLTILVDVGLQRVDDRFAAFDFADQFADGDLDGYRFCCLLYRDGVSHLAPVHILCIGSSLHSSQFLSVRTIHIGLVLNSSASINHVFLYLFIHHIGVHN